MIKNDPRGQIDGDQDLPLEEIDQDLPLEEIDQDLQLEEIVQDLQLEEIDQDLQLEEIDKLNKKYITHSKPYIDIASKTALFCH
jgi:hypothetical protein